MKKTAATAFACIAFGASVLASGPVATYQWDFNLTNSASGTNLIYSKIPGGDVQDPGAPTQEAVLQMQNSSATPVNLLGLPGSGVGIATFDRAVLLAGTMGGTGPIIRTPALANALTNLGILTNFTVTAWIKADSAFSGFPRILMFGQQNLDTGSGVNNVTFLQFNPGDTLQLKVNGLGANGINGPTGLLTAGASDWLFVAVTYDSTVDPTVTSNVFFYSGDRFNTLGAGSGAAYGVPNGAGISVNSVPPANVNGPGYVNLSGGLNGDGGVDDTNAFPTWVYVGNRNGNARSFDGRYDDIRIYANQVLSQAQLDLVRLDANLPPPQRLTIISQPQNTTVAEGQGASFTALTTPVPNRTYQWYRINPGGSVSNAIAGATNQLYETPQLTVASDNGATYAVRVHSTDPFSDFNGVGVYSTYAVASVISTTAYVSTPGMLKFEYFTADNGASVDTFLATPSANYLNNTPDLTTYLQGFDTRDAFPDDSHFNYFVRITGSIIPTISTNYVFYIRAADQGELYLSTDGGVSSNLVCSDVISGPQVFTGPESTASAPGGQFSTPIALTAGTNYPITAFLKASTGVNLLQVAWKTDSGNQDLPASDEDIADRLQPIPAAVLSTLAPPSGTIAITSQPQPAAPSIGANQKVTFKIGVSAALSTNNSATTNGPVVVQWQKNGVNIPGATGASYTTPYLQIADSGAQYGAVISIPGLSTNSSTATVTVGADSSTPTVVSATPDDSMTAITVQFSEPVDAITALNPLNYKINGGALAVTGVTWAANSNTNLTDTPSFDAVKLSTALQTDNAPYTVVVTGVQDRTTHTIAGGNSAKFQAYGFIPGFSKFEYFENQTYSTLSGLDVNAFVTFSPKFTNSDPDTIVYPTSMEMSPDGTPTIRSSGGGNLNTFPPFYGTRMSAVFVPPVTTNYVFYMAANDTGILWLSTDANPANKHVIAWQDLAAGKWTWTGQTPNNSSATFVTNFVGTFGGVTAPGASPWPTGDGNGFALITLQAGQRYYIEQDHLENGGFDSFDAVTYVTAADNTTVTPPANGSAPALTGSVIGWHLPQPQITSFVNNGSNVNIAWTNGFGPINLGAAPYPGIAPGTITGSFPPSPSLQTTPTLSPTTWTTLTNTSPATIAKTNSIQFYRIGE